MSGYVLGMILVMSFVSVGARWDEAWTRFWNKPKPKETETQAKPRERPGQDSQAKSDRAPGGLEEANQNVQAIQSQLRQIIDRTRVLQQQAVGDRAEVDRILNRARIHEQILRTLNVREPVRVVTPVDRTKILEWEKVRLISEQARRSQDALRTLEQSRGAPKPAGQPEPDSSML